MRYPEDLHDKNANSQPIRSTVLVFDISADAVVCVSVEVNNACHSIIAWNGSASRRSALSSFEYAQ